MSQRIDVHQAITDRIIQAIEQGAGEFKLPWHRPAGSITRPTNIQSKKAYRGINVVTLWVEAQLKGYATPVWGTYKQMSEAGCQVRVMAEPCFAWTARRRASSSSISRSSSSAMSPTGLESLPGRRLGTSPAMTTPSAPRGWCEHVRSWKMRKSLVSLPISAAPVTLSRKSNHDRSLTR